MKILPIAFDSLGVRSMATYVETSDVRIFVDPGVSVSPDRYSLPPHRVELDRHREMWEAIVRWVEMSDIVIVTHYHFDHHNPDRPEIYKDKDVFLKHPREFVNQSQKERAANFLSRIEPYAKSITIADGKVFNFGNTHVSFSEPVLHGLTPQLGYVIQVLVEDDKRFLFTSDVQGPLNCGALDFILAANPDIMFIDGPATYLLGSHHKKADVDQSIENLKKIIDRTRVTSLVIDHHLLRDLNWFDYVKDMDKVRSGLVVCSAAGFLGKQEDQLEAKRKDMYNGQPL
jgi:predicted metallo-beta-lactamase superfamily hydrolase